MTRGRRRGGGLGALLLALGAAAPGCGVQPPWYPDMAETPAVHADEELRPPPSGSVHRRGEMRRSRFESAGLRNPLPASPETLARGAGLFAIYCEPCHGARGRGDGPLAPYFRRPPRDLTGPRVRAQPDGFIYATIRDGAAGMPAYGWSLAPDERWAVVHYLRSLQR